MKNRDFTALPLLLKQCWLACGLLLHTYAVASAESPLNIGGSTYREFVNFVGGGSTGTVILNRDGTYETIYSHGTSTFIANFFPVVHPPERGNYTYVKTGNDTGTLVFFSQSEQSLFAKLSYVYGPALNNGPIERTLKFEASSSGTIQFSDTSGVFGRKTFELTKDSAPLSNASTRGQAAISNPLILGFVVSGTKRTVLIRAVGPTLAQYGVKNAATETEATLYSSDGSIVRYNNQWSAYTAIVERGKDYSANATGETLQSLFSRLGAFQLPPESKDSAILAELAPGAYTVLIRTLSQTNREVLGEIYILP